MSKILVYSALASDTGAAVRAKYLAEAIDKSGVSCRLVIPPRRTLPLKLDCWLSLPRYLSTLWRERPKVILGIKSYPNVGLVCLVQKWLGGKSVLDTDDLSYAYSKGFWRRLSKLAQELFLPLADLHTYHRPGLRRYLASKGILKERLYRLEQGVGELFFKSFRPQEINAIKHRLGFKKEKVLVFVGHFDIACDLGELLVILAPVLTSQPKVRLLVVGDGPRRAEYEQLTDELEIAAQVAWSGLVDPDEVPKLVAVADIGLVYYEQRKANFYRSSMKLREYLALAKPVVANDYGELKEWKKYVYQSKTDHESYRRVLKKVLFGRGDDRSTKGREFVSRTAGWQLIGKNFVQEIKKRGWLNE